MKWFAMHEGTLVYESVFDESDILLCPRSRHSQHSKRSHHGSCESPTRMCCHGSRLAMGHRTLRNRIFHSADPVFLFHLPVWSAASDHASAVILPVPHWGQLFPPESFRHRSACSSLDCPRSKFR